MYILVLSGDCPSDTEAMPPPAKRSKATLSSSSLGSASKGSGETPSQPGKFEQLSEGLHREMLHTTMKILCELGYCVYVCVCVCACACMRVCMCLCVYARESVHVQYSVCMGG